MARKQAQRRTRTQNPRIELPKIQLSRVITPLVAVLMVAATYRVSTGLLDRNIDSIEVTGPFQRVSALQIEEAVSDELDAGFLGADLGLMQAQVRDLSYNFHDQVLLLAKLGMIGNRCTLRSGNSLGLGLGLVFKPANHGSHALARRLGQAARGAR